MLLFTFKNQYIVRRTFASFYCAQLRRTLTRHVREVHCESKNFLCELCQATFKARDAMKQHMRKKHPGSVIPSAASTSVLLKMDTTMPEEENLLYDGPSTSVVAIR